LFCALLRLAREDLDRQQLFVATGVVCHIDSGACCLPPVRRRTVAIRGTGIALAAGNRAYTIP
jgi:hypothetical protein